MKIIKRVVKSAPRKGSGSLRFTIPKEVVGALELEVGDYILFEIKGGVVTLKKLDLT